MNAIVGVAVEGAGKGGALCADHWKALSGQPGVTFFTIQKGKKPCNVCTQIRKETGR